VYTRKLLYYIIWLVCTTIEGRTDTCLCEPSSSIPLSFQFSDEARKDAHIASKHRCAAVLGRTQGCHIKIRNWKVVMHHKVS